MIFQAGYAEKPVTPAIPVPMCGYGVYLGRTASGVLDDLHVRVLCIETGGVRAAIASFDLVGFTPAFASRLRSEIASELSTDERLVTIGCTHTHSGPPTAPLRGMGDVDAAYAEVIVASAREAALAAAADSVEAEGGFAASPIEPFGFNRNTRDFSLIDPILSVLSFVPVARDHSPIVVVSYACHAVTLGMNREVSADYPGRFVASLGKSGFRSLFLQGFCGNIDPVTNLVAWGSGSEAEIDRYGEHLATSAKRVFDRRTPIESRIGSRFGSAAIPYDLRELPAAHEARLRRTYGAAWSTTIDRFVSEARSDYELLRSGPRGAHDAPALPVPVQLLDVGGVVLACVGAEVHATIGTTARKLHDRLIPVGYANGVVGYLPDAVSYRNPDSYEAYLAPFFYGPAPLDPAAPHIIGERIEHMLEEDTI
jgi:hypothetical protein